MNFIYDNNFSLVFMTDCIWVGVNYGMNNILKSFSKNVWLRTKYIKKFPCWFVESFIDYESNLIDFWDLRKGYLKKKLTDRGSTKKI